MGPSYFNHGHRRSNWWDLSNLVKRQRIAVPYAVRAPAIHSVPDLVRTPPYYKKRCNATFHGDARPNIFDKSITEGRPVFSNRTGSEILN